MLAPAPQRYGFRLAHSTLPLYSSECRNSPCHPGSLPPRERGIGLRRHQAHCGRTQRLAATWRHGGEDIPRVRLPRDEGCPETRVAQRRGALGGAGSAHAPQAGGAPLRRVLVLAYLGGFRCAESSLFISNIVTLCLPNTFSSLASARI